MSSTAVTAMEITFNVLYLIAIYVLVFIMYGKFRQERHLQKNIAGPFLLAFLLLAVGDTGHVGFRVAAYALGGLDENALLVGLGALATAATVTVFYMLMLHVWQTQSGGKKGPIYWTIISLGVVRLVFMTIPGNRWGQVIPPMEFSYVRNIFLTVMGLAVAALYLNLSRTKNRSFNMAAGICILISYGFYIPVILFIRSVPMLGMLMIPKTLAYVAIAIIGNKHLFVPAGSAKVVSA